MEIIREFERVYKREPWGRAFCPYRVCPVGAHVDHQLGKITGFAISEGVSIAYAPKQNGVVELSSLQFPKRAQWHIFSTPNEKQNDWADCLRGATIALSKRYPLRVGLCGVIKGGLPIGGLSSSASVTIAFLSALCKVNGISLTEMETILIAKQAENEYVGVACGKLDQSCEVYSKKNYLLYLDTKTDEYELIPVPASMKPYKIAILFSGIERSLASSKFNMRVDECRSASYALQAYAGQDYGKFEESYMRDIPLEVYLAHRDKLPLSWRKRAEHYFSEQERVERAVQAWRVGDVEAYGKLSFESGKSSNENWETGSDELCALYDLMRTTDGVYGGRFSGAGFKGCCMALIDPAFEQSITEKITAGYLQKFPALREKFSIHICESADGVQI